MSSSYSIGQRHPKLNGVLASLACVIALTLTVGPALAQGSTDLARVEVQGRMVEAPVRYDVRAGCAAIEAQLQEALGATWVRERRAGEVRVQFVIDGGEVTAVKANGISHSVARSVRTAVRALECGQQASAGAQVYRFSVDFIDPYSQRDSQGQAGTATAGAQPGIRVSLSSN